MLLKLLSEERNIVHLSDHSDWDCSALQSFRVSRIHVPLALFQHPSRIEEVEPLNEATQSDSLIVSLLLLLSLGSLLLKLCLLISFKLGSELLVSLQLDQTATFVLLFQDLLLHSRVSLTSYLLFLDSVSSLR